MDLSAEQQQISKNAVKWLDKKANFQKLQDVFVNTKSFPPATLPVTAFMAGSPGAGKTEFVKELKKIDTKGQLGQQPFAVIDPDAIRDFLPGYSGSNSYLFQNAISIAVGKLFRMTLKNRQNVIVDGTFANYDRAKENVERALANKTQIVIFYVFQHPAVAWDFTLKREAVEGRRIRKNDFIDKFIRSKECVDRIKKEFEDKIQLNIIVKDYKDTKFNKRIANAFVDVMDIAEHTGFTYTKEELKKYLL